MKNTPIAFLVIAILAACNNKKTAETSDGDTGNISYTVNEVPCEKEKTTDKTFPAGNGEVKIKLIQSCMRDNAIQDTLVADGAGTISVYSNYVHNILFTWPETANNVTITKELLLAGASNTDIFNRGILGDVSILDYDAATNTATFETVIQVPHSNKSKTIKYTVNKAGEIKSLN